MKIKNLTTIDLTRSWKFQNKFRLSSALVLFFTTLLILPSVQNLVFAEESDNLTDNDNFTKKSTYYKVASPREQVESGVPPAAVVCNVGFQLIFKASDGSPACVKPESVEALVERGWAQSTDWQDFD